MVLLHIYSLLTFHLSHVFLHYSTQKLSMTMLIISLSLILGDLIRIDQTSFPSPKLLLSFISVSQLCMLSSNFSFIPFCLTGWFPFLQPLNYMNRPVLGKRQHIFISSGSMIQVISVKLHEDLASPLFNSSLIL